MKPKYPWNNESRAAFMRWMHRPVYVVQCRTYAIARQLFGLAYYPGQSLVTRADFDQELTHPLDLFRARRQYRTPEANALRSKVAAEIRAQRAQRRAA